MIYGYIRCSTDHQNTINQRFEINNFAKKNNITIDFWVEETLSSQTDIKKRKLNSLLKKLQKGDILITTELSRLGRNLLQVMSILHFCLDKECQIWTLKENYKLGSDIQSKVLAFAFSLSAEIERNLISSRTKEALKRVKSEGKKLGRPLSPETLRLNENKDKIKELLQNNLSKTEISKIMNVNWTTLHRFIKKYHLH